MAQKQKSKSKSWLTKQLEKLQAQLDQQVEDSNHIATSVDIVDTVGTNRYPDVHTNYRADSVHKVIQQDSAILFQSTNGLSLHLHLITDTILRFRYARNGKFPTDFSYAIDPEFSPKKVAYIFEEKKSKYSIQTPKLICEIGKKNLKVTLKNLNGQVINEDAEGYYSQSMLLKGVTTVQMSKKAPQSECFFGLGDKSCDLNLRGKKLQNWCTDSFGYGYNSDPLYRAIPFYFGLNQGLGYGIFFDNSFKSHFDFDEQAEGKMTFAAEGGDMNYYFIYGPELLSVAEQYTLLTGRPELPPMWSLGFHQCRWSYYPENRVLEVAQTFRDKKIPCDAIYLDIDYMDGYRCFTWNKEHFPKPAKMIKKLVKKGFQTVVMIDPGIREDDDYHVYRQGVDNDYFCRRTDGTLMQGPVWPPNCGFPDFTKPEVRDWWGNLYEGLYNEDGISGFWNDMNEPAMFKVHHCTFPDEVIHDHDGHVTNHAKAHNIYGLQMSRSTTAGLKKLQPEKRPFLVTRATFSGGQRFAAVWTGDNIATWEHLQLGNRQCQRLSASGFSFVGTDIGGFFQYPDGELMVRWLQMGIFHPFYRVHSMGNNDDGSAEADAEKVRERDMRDRLDQEPWAFGPDFTPASRAAIELRYQLLPYIYTAFWQYTTKGTPMIRSLSFYDQQDEKTLDKEVEFIFGDNLLVAPVTQPEVEKVKVYLPKGTWFNYWTGKSYKGGKYVTCKVRLNTFPLFVKAGAVLPLYPVMQYTNEKKVETLKLKVYAGTSNNNDLYEDRGEGYAYQNEDYSLRQFSTKRSGKKLTVTHTKKGNRTSDYRQIKLAIYGIAAVNSCKVDGKEVDFDFKKGVLNCMVSTDFGAIVIKSY
ncbi:MAG: glycoside hydrolase family 31 protein [Bacteroidota bacterium]